MAGNCRRADGRARRPSAGNRESENKRQKQDETDLLQHISSKSEKKPVASSDENYFAVPPEQGQELDGLL
jgi:hypothetical protein